MAYTGLTSEQRARVGDASSAALMAMVAGPAKDRPAFGPDSFLELAEASRLLIAELERRQADYVVEAVLRGALWEQVAEALQMRRQSAAGRWSEAVAAERAARASEGEPAPAMADA